MPPWSELKRTETWRYLSMGTNSIYLATAKLSKPVLPHDPSYPAFFYMYMDHHCDVALYRSQADGWASDWTFAVCTKWVDSNASMRMHVGVTAICCHSRVLTFMMNILHNFLVVSIDPDTWWKNGNVHMDGQGLQQTSPSKAIVPRGNKKQDGQALQNIPFHQNLRTEMTSSTWVYSLQGKRN